MATITSSNDNQCPRHDILFIERDLTRPRIISFKKSDEHVYEPMMRADNEPHPFTSSGKRN